METNTLNTISTNLALVSKSLHSLVSESKGLNHSFATVQRSCDRHVTVNLRVDIYRVEDIDLPRQQFSCEFDLHVSWLDEERAKSLSKACDLEDFESGWHPEIFFPNAVKLNMVQKTFSTRSEDAMLCVTYRIHGTFKTDFNLRDFPFDYQMLRISVSSKWNRDVVLFRQDPDSPSSISSYPQVVEDEQFNVEGVVSTGVGFYENYAFHGKSTFSVCTFEVPIRRRQGIFLLHYIPSFFLLGLLALVVFAISFRLPGQRILIAVILLLAAMLLKTFVHGSCVPTAHAFTLFDKYWLTCAVFIFLVALESAIAAVMSSNQKDFDVAFFVILLLAFLAFHIIFMLLCLRKRRQIALRMNTIREYYSTIARGATLPREKAEPEHELELKVEREVSKERKGAEPITIDEFQSTQIDIVDAEPPPFLDAELPVFVETEPLALAKAEPLDLSPAQTADLSPAQPADLSPAQPADLSPTEPPDISPPQSPTHSPAHPPTLSPTDPPPPVEKKSRFSWLFSAERPSEKKLPPPVQAKTKSDLKKGKRRSLVMDMTVSLDEPKFEASGAMIQDDLTPAPEPFVPPSYLADEHALGKQGSFDTEPDINVPQLSTNEKESLTYESFNPFSSAGRKQSPDTDEPGGTDKVKNDNVNNTSEEGTKPEFLYQQPKQSFRFEKETSPGDQSTVVTMSPSSFGTDTVGNPPETQTDPDDAGQSHRLSAFYKYSDTVPESAYVIPRYPSIPLDDLIVTEQPPQSNPYDVIPAKKEPQYSYPPSPGGPPKLTAERDTSGITKIEPIYVYSPGEGNGYDVSLTVGPTLAHDDALPQEPLLPSGEPMYSTVASVLPERGIPSEDSSHSSPQESRAPLLSRIKDRKKEKSKAVAKQAPKVKSNDFPSSDGWL